MSHKITVTGFFLILFSLPLLFLFGEKERFSDMENRYLAEPPVWSVRAFLSRRFMDELEAYFSDHFFLRDTFVTVKGEAEYLSGKREFGGVYAGNTRLLLNVKPPQEDHVLANIEAVKTFARSNREVPVMMMLVPTAVAVLQNELPDYFPVYNQKELIARVSRELAPDVISIDLFNEFYAHQSEYIYYRTDHHWTTLGAYYAYQQFCHQMRYTPKTLDSLDVETVAYDFFGTLYAKSAYRRVAPDTVQVMHYNYRERVESFTVFDGRKTTTYPSLYFPEFLNTKDKYSYFLGQNQPMQQIRTNLGNDRSILIFKDSYADSFAPFLAMHYSRITLLDLRYLNEGYLPYADPSEYDLVLILYNVDTLLNSADLLKLNW